MVETSDRFTCGQLNNKLIDNAQWKLDLDLFIVVHKKYEKDQDACIENRARTYNLVLLVLLMYNHEQIQVEFPLGVVDELVVQMSTGEPVTGFYHGISVRNLLVRPKLVVLPWWTYGLRKDRLYHIFHCIRGVLSPIHMPRFDVLHQLVKSIPEPCCISHPDLVAVNFSLGTTVVLPLDACAPRCCRFRHAFPIFFYLFDFFC